jgi:heat shock protein HtpX
MTQFTPNIYKNQSNNVLKTWFYLIIFALLLLSLGVILAQYFQNPLFLYIGFLVAIVTNIGSYWFSDKLVLSMAGAKQIEIQDNPELFNLVENLSRVAGIPMPKVYIMDDPSPNAFATGRNPNNSAVAFTTGILALLNKQELEGVIAHELAHIVNRDTLIMTVVAVMASVISFVAQFAMHFSQNKNENQNVFVTIFGFIFVLILAPLAATIIQMAISRKREFLADASAAMYTRYPEGLANALQKITSFPVPMRDTNTAIAHLFISDPYKNENKDDEVHAHNHNDTPWYTKLFMTHPPVQDRIKALIG